MQLRARMRTIASLVPLVGLLLLIFAWLTSGSITGTEENIQENLSKYRINERVKRRASKASSLMPEFSAPIGNITAVVGRDVRLVCTVENLGQYQVAWLKEETRTILSIDTNIIITNYRIFLIPDEEERKWVLHIKDVQESDRLTHKSAQIAANFATYMLTLSSTINTDCAQGFYQCQVNTKPMRSTSGYLEVVVPPTIVESQSSQVAETVEHANVSLQCKANGHPRPTISWRRDDGKPIKLAGLFDSLESEQQQKQLQNSPVIEASGSNVAQQNQRIGYAADEPTASGGNSSTSAGGGQVAERQPVATQLTDIKSDKLALYDVDRSMAGIYVCSASNGIPSQESKRIPLFVKFAPKTSVQSKFISINLGDPVEIECLIEAFPKPRSHWAKKSPSIPSLHLVSHRGASGARWSRLVAPSEAIDSGERRAASYRGNELLIVNNWSESENITGDSLTLTGEQLASWRRLNRRQRRGQAGNEINFKRQVNEMNENQLEESPGGYDEEEEAAAASDEAYEQRRRIAASYRRLSSPVDLGAETVITPNSLISRSNDEYSQGQTSPTTSSRAYVTVKQTALNSYTYKLKMTIARMHLEDFGQYTCVAANSMGESESSITLTRADRHNERTKARQPTIEPVNQKASGELDYYQRDSLNNRPYVHLPPPGQSKDVTRARGGGSGSAGSSGSKVYDENYLQAIKTRQNHLAVSGKLQQKLKSTHNADRNSAAQSKEAEGRLLAMTITLALATIVSLRRHHHM